MSQKDIWKKYITAQSKILEHKSKPIGIDTSRSIKPDGNKLHLSIDQEIFKRVFKKEVEELFNIEDFNFDTGYIQTSIENTRNITTEGLNKLNELSEICYIDFNENPVIEGVIEERGNNIKNQIINIIGRLPTDYRFNNSGLLYLTIEQWNKCKKIDNVKFGKTHGAIFSIKPSISYLISTFYRKLDISQNGNEIKIKGELHQPVFELFNRHFGLTKRRNDLIYEFQNVENLSEKIEGLERKGLELPKPSESTLIFILDEANYEKYDTDLSFENFRLKRALQRYFPDAIFRTSYTTTYSFDHKALNEGFKALDRNEDGFWEELYTNIHGDDFQISKSRRTASFDFKTEEELKQKSERLQSFAFLDIYDRGADHKYKFNIKFETGLHELQGKINSEFPNLNTKLIANGDKLIFRQFYKAGDGNLNGALAHLQNQLDDFIDAETFSYTINDRFLVKYLCEENFELKVEQEEEKLSKLLRQDFYFGKPKGRLNEERFYLGKLQKVSYPDLTFVIEEDILQEVEKNVVDETVKALFPDLKGEKDKIKRLKDTVIKLDSEIKLPNDNAKEFLYDSSKAKGIDNIGILLNQGSEKWQNFENNLFSKELNPSQREAVFKSLYAEELAVIQGPPGTGKSTAIAEIIWHHIRKEQKQKILLTSETNLAVDNAINRLKIEQNNVVKPIRFGNIKNLESEGYFYSLEAIEVWKSSSETNSNTVSHWINNISNRVTRQDDIQIDSALDKWKNHLQNPKANTKKLFADKYLEYVNLIGATGSSIGKENSENKWTSFFRSYLKTFNRENYENKNYDSLNRINISFDTIIMDEASKATPPELALPVLYGKKSIIVGDHRQLPPMIDGREIKDLLTSIGEKELANTLSQKEFEISQFERLFINIDESIKGIFNTQYRMHPAINEAIAQFYKEDSEDGLICGLPLDETYHDSFDKWDSRYHGLKFKNIITPETHTIWINVTTP